MVYLGSLISPNPHQHIQHVEIVTFKESTLKAPLPQSLPSASVNEITVEPHNLWLKQLHEYMKWNVIPLKFSMSEKCMFKKNASSYTIYRRCGL